MRGHRARTRHREGDRRSAPRADQLRQRPRRGTTFTLMLPDGGARPPAHRPAPRRRARGGVVRRPPPAVLALVAFLAGSGCLPTRNAPQPAAPTAQSEWPAVYARRSPTRTNRERGAADRGSCGFRAALPWFRGGVRGDLLARAAQARPGNAAAVRDRSRCSTRTSRAHPRARTAPKRACCAGWRSRSSSAMPPSPRSARAAVRPEDKARDEELARLRTS